MGPNLNLPRIFLGKTKGGQRGGLLFFFSESFNQSGRATPHGFFWGQVSINEECECATHQSFLNTSFTERSNICHAGLEPVMASTPQGNGLACLDKIKRPDYLIILTWPVSFIDSRTPKLTLPAGPSFPRVSQHY